MPSKSRVKTGPTRKRRDAERNKAPRHFRSQDEYNNAIDNLDRMRGQRNETEKQRQWGLDKSRGGVVPEYYDYPEERDDNSPMTRTEKRFIERAGL